MSGSSTSSYSGSTIISTRNTGHSTLNTGLMSRENFLKGLGVAGAGIAAGAMGFGGVARAQESSMQSTIPPSIAGAGQKPVLVSSWADPKTQTPIFIDSHPGNAANVLPLSPTSVPTTFDPDPGPGYTPVQFPLSSGFLFGVAGSSWQDEGQALNQTIDSNGNIVQVGIEMVKSNWYNFSNMGGILSGETNLLGNGFNVLYASDFQRAKGIGLNSVRISIEWARVQPRQPSYGDDGFDYGQIGHYIQMLLTAKAIGLEPIVTFYHFTLPEWVQQGTPNGVDMLSLPLDNSATPTPSPFANAFANYVGTMLGSFVQYGVDIKYYTPINEPNVAAIFGYVLGTFAPGVPGDISKALNAITNMALAHAITYQLIKNFAGTNTTNVGISLNISMSDPLPPTSELVPLDPAGNTLRDILGLPSEISSNDYIAQNITNYIVNSSFIDALSRTDITDYFGDTIDFIGVQYYSKNYVVSVPCNQGYEQRGALDLSSFLGYPPGSFCAIVAINPVVFNLKPGDDHDNWMDAENFKEVLTTYAGYGKPLIVTENGLADSSNLPNLPPILAYIDAQGNPVYQPAPGSLRTCPGSTYPDCINRAKYLLEHLYVVGELIGQGMDIQGYIHWSDVDDFEWNQGTTDRFGLYRDDYTYTYNPDLLATLGTERIPTSGADFLKNLLVDNGGNLTRDLWAQYDLQYFATDFRPYFGIETTDYVKNTRWCMSATPTITRLTAVPASLTATNARVNVTLNVSVKHHCALSVEAKIASVRVSGAGNGLMLGLYKVTGPLSLELKAQSGVKYDVTVQVTDANGHRDTQNVVIPVIG